MQRLGKKKDTIDLAQDHFLVLSYTLFCTWSVTHKGTTLQSCFGMLFPIWLTILSCDRMASSYNTELTERVQSYEGKSDTEFNQHQAATLEEVRDNTSSADIHDKELSAGVAKVEVRNRRFYVPRIICWRYCHVGSSSSLGQIRLHIPSLRSHFGFIHLLSRRCHDIPILIVCDFDRTRAFIDGYRSNCWINHYRYRQTIHGQTFGLHWTWWNLVCAQRSYE